jgi:glycosyltransferase involved in cell wall biosynthesis
MKGHRVVVEAIASAGFTLSGAHVAFVGRGSSEAAIREAITRAGLEGRIRLTGFATDVAASMTALDVALYVPLESDGMSRVLFEYLAAGRAVIASRVGVVPEVLRDGVDALLVPAGDAAALAEALVRLTGHPALRERLGRAARQAVEERYSGARLAERLEVLYGRLVPG